MSASDEPKSVSGRGRAWSLFKLAAGLVLVIGSSIAVAWGAHRYALTTPRFAVTDVHVQGAARLSYERVLAVAGVERGDNIFALDVGEIKARLLADPWIASADVTRRLPAELDIRLEERQARALCALEGRLFLVSRGGELFKEWQRADPHDLPVLTGISVANLARDRAREMGRVSELLELLADYEKLSVARAFPPQELHIAPGGAVTLTVGESGLALHLGRGAWREKLSMAEVVIKRARKRGSVPRALFLDNRAHPERLVMRMR